MNWDGTCIAECPEDYPRSETANVCECAISTYCDGETVTACTDNCDICFSDGSCYLCSGDYLLEDAACVTELYVEPVVVDETVTCDPSSPAFLAFLILFLLFFLCTIFFIHKNYGSTIMGALKNIFKKKKVDALTSERKASDPMKSTWDMQTEKIQSDTENFKEKERPQENQETKNQDDKEKEDEVVNSIQEK